MGILSEDFQHKLGSVIDGQENLKRELSDKIESTAGGLRKELTDKIDAVAKDLRKEIQEVKSELIAHRDNTEVHAHKC